MAEASFSATERALENQRIGALQIGVVAICVLIQMCDGYDVGSIGWAVPSLTHAWNLPPSAFSLAFLWSNLGVMAGALASGPIGDRFGRKPLLLASVAIFGVASLASAFAGSLGLLSALRFFTGLGIAGAFSGTTALTGDYTPQRLRATMIMVTFTGAPLGGFVGGLIVAALLRHYTCRSSLFWAVPFRWCCCWSWRYGCRNRRASSPASQTCRRGSRLYWRGSTSRGRRQARIQSTLPPKTRSSCCSAADMR